MMNNHFHLPPEHPPPPPPPPSVAHHHYLQQAPGAPPPPLSLPPVQAPAPAPVPAGASTAAYGYLPPTAPGQQPQWMTTYQLLPPGGPNGGQGKQFFTTQTMHPGTIQITNSFAQHPGTPKHQQPTKLMAGMTGNPGNNFRIISTASNVYGLNKSPQEHPLYGPVHSIYLPGAGGQAGGQLNPLMGKQLQPPPLVPVRNPPSAASTVLLDRINICINNHYAEPPSALSSTQQPSPIIPAIQHKALAPLIDSSTADSSSCSSSSVSSSSFGGGGTSASTAVVVVDEPDSTTATPQTPPTTPETINSPGKSSPSPSPPMQSLLKTAGPLKPSFKAIDAAPPTPPTPPSPPPPEPVAAAPASPPAITYALQEDVFIKCNDGRFYLGTIIEQTDEQFLIRFDDKSEQWCEPDKLRKLGGGSASTASGGGSSASESLAASGSGPMCVACKRADLADVVEICERCGRGYHRGCTIEIMTGVWSCKRCAKPMKVQKPLKLEFSKPAGICRQLPYHADKLSWDEKHRVNEEQIYCYCGKPGKFDHKMLQCCKCSNWFHTQCLQEFKWKLLRGDIFFVFCCTVCNEGVEFVRRLQIEWVDVIHLALYNLGRHQNKRYQHLLKDIWPFILEQRHQLPVRKEWRTMPETALMEHLKRTLRERSDRFVSAKEFKRASAFYALRHSGPPLIPKICLEAHEKLSDELLTGKLKLTVVEEGGRGKEDKKEGETPKGAPPKDVYEFHTDEEEQVETSEDEIPIKQIIEKAKKQVGKGLGEQEQKQKPVPLEAVQIDLADDNANDGDPGKVAAPVAPLLSSCTNSSRKRKAFRLSKRYDSSRNHCDLSSDENSSSSRGTSSLDLIIPPPANFLGRNNPFLMATPKKSTVGRGCGVGVSLAAAIGISGIFKLRGSGKEQPRIVRTIKRRLSAKDITIGPNQEVRRRRTRRLTTASEVISTTTINPIPSHYLPIYAKDLQPPPAPPLGKPSHGRLLRQRPQKTSPSQSRRNSTSSTATNGSSSNGAGGAGASAGHSMMDLKQSVNKYFGGAMNRIEAGESFAIRAKRRTGNGQVQYLVEWGGDAAASATAT